MVLFLYAIYYTQITLSHILALPLFIEPINKGGILCMLRHLISGAAVQLYILLLLPWVSLD